MSILNNLNKEQKAAASAVKGPVLVIAGAGSGKTRTLTYRIAYMVKEMDIDPKSILAVTFTNKAVNEMKTRIKSMLGDVNVHISTFHSFGVFLLRRYMHILDRDKNFNIYDMDDQKRVVSGILKRFNIDINSSPSKISSRIGKLKERGVLPSQVKVKTDADRKFVEIYRKYQEDLKANNSIDFADILIYTLKILENKDILEEVQERYVYIMVDEHQDLNDIQEKIVKKLSSLHNNVFVVGDPNQGIYSFRGANLDNILNFEKNYKGAQVYHLTKNYRSVSNILNAANHVIKNNEDAAKLELVTDKLEGELISIYKAKDGRREAKYVSKKISELVKNGYKYSDCTILYRNNFQTRELEEEFIRVGLPYKVYGGMQFYQRKEIKDMLSYLYFLNNTKDRLSFSRIINSPPRGIGQITLEKLTNILDENSDLDVIGAIEKAQTSELFSTNIKKTLVLFKGMIDKLENMKKEPVSKILDYLANKSGYIKYLEEREEHDRIKNVKELIEASKSYDDISLSEYLEMISLTATKNVEESDDFIKLMTIHSSKGLEFKVVFLTGVEEEVFPNANAVYENKIPEERRLFYVAITRAEELLFISYAKSRSIYSADSRYREKSRFIEELPEHLVDFSEFVDKSEHRSEVLFKAIKEMKEKREEAKKEIESSKLARMKKLRQIVGFDLGDIVTHKVFGKGKIVGMSLDKVVVCFEGVGDKKFLSATASKFISKS